MPILLDLASNNIKVEISKTRRQGTHFAVSDWPVVNLGDGGNLDSSSDEEDFIGEIEFRPVNRALDDFEAELVVHESDGSSPCDTFKNIISNGRGQHLSLTNDEDILGRSLRHMTVLVEHNCLVESGSLCIGLDKCGVHVRTGDLSSRWDHIVIHTTP